MSYILDALKKSDTERKQGDVPNLQTIHIPIAIEPQAPLALYGLISVLLLVLAFIVGWIVADKEQPTGIVQVVEPELPQVVQTQGSLNDVAQADKALSTQTSKPVIQKNKHNAAVAEGTARVVQRKKTEIDIEPAKIDSTKIEPARVEPARDESASAESAKNNNSPTIQHATRRPDLSDIPYLQEMPDYQQQSVPQMTFAGHVYSSAPSNRSVIINDVFMSEGDTVLQGIDVVEITPSGVVFSLHEDFFRMDILQDWSFE